MIRSFHLAFIVFGFKVQKYKSYIHSTIRTFDFRPIVIPMVISATLMSLSALSGYLSLTQIYLNKFRDYEELWKEKSYEEIVNNADISDMDDDFDSKRNVHMDITSLILGIGVATSAACALLVGRVGVKTLLLLSSSLMAASMFFLSLLSHFSQGGYFSRYHYKKLDKFELIILNRLMFYFSLSSYF